MVITLQMSRMRCGSATAFGRVVLFSFPLSTPGSRPGLLFSVAPPGLDFVPGGDLLSAHKLDARLRDGLPEDGGKKSLDPPEEATVFGLIWPFRGRRLNHGIEMNLPRRRILYRQVAGCLHRRRGGAGCAVFGVEHKRRIDLYVNVIRLGSWQRRGLWPIRQPVSEAVAPKEVFPAGAGGVSLPPIRTFDGNSDSGTFGANGASARMVGEGVGHPHSNGTSASTLSICPE